MQSLEEIKRGLESKELEELDLLNDNYEYVIDDPSIKVVPVDTLRNSHIPKHQIISAFPHGSHWATTLKIPCEVPYWVMSQFYDREFIHELDPDSPSLFLKTNLPHQEFHELTQDRPLYILRYNLSYHRLIFQAPVSLSVEGKAEIHSAQPIFLPSGAHPVPGNLHRIDQWRNYCEWNHGIRLHPDLKSGSKIDCTIHPANRKFLDIVAYAPDGPWNYDEYLKGNVTHYFLTALAEFVVVEPTKECRFDILPPQSSERFQGVLGLPPQLTPTLAANPTQYSDIHGVVLKVEDYKDDRLYLNHPRAGKFWVLTLDVAGAIIEMISLRHNLSHHKLKTIAEKNNPKYEDTVVPPKPGDRVYAKAWIQAFSAHDPRNLPLTKDNKRRTFRNMRSVMDHCSGLEDNSVFRPKNRKKDPFIFFPHSKHIFNCVLAAVFDSPVKTILDTEKFGLKYHFPTMREEARLTTAKDYQDLDLSTSCMSYLFDKAKKPVKFSPLGTPAPSNRSLSSKLDQRLLAQFNPTALDPKFKQEQDISTYQKFFTIVLEYLTLPETLFLAQASKKSNQIIQNNFLYWSLQFNDLKLHDPTIYFPDAGNPTGLTGLRQWAKVLYMKQALHKQLIRRNLDFITATGLIDPYSKSINEAVAAQFNSRTHICGLCSKAKVSYGDHIKGTKLTSIPHMACSTCLKTHLWLQDFASLLWGIHRDQFKEIRGLRTAQDIYYTTADLYHHFIQMHARLVKPSPFQSEKEVTTFKKMLVYLKEKAILNGDTLTSFEKVLKEYEAIKQDRDQFLYFPDPDNIDENAMVASEVSDQKTIKELKEKYRNLPSLVQSLISLKETTIHSLLILHKQLVYPTPAMQKNLELQEAIQRSFTADKAVVDSVFSTLKGKEDPEIQKFLLGREKNKPR